MNFDIEKQKKKIKRMEFDIKGNYVLNIIMGLMLGTFIKKIFFNSNLILFLCIITCLYNAYKYAVKQQEKIDKLKWEIDMYLNTLK